MFINIHPSWFVIIPSCLIGAFLVISGDNWFIIWIGFELTLFSFLPLFSGGSLIFEGIINYFLTQAGGSSVFVLSFLLFNSTFSNNTIVLSIIINLGLFPFHIWVPLVISTMTWGGCALLLTVQNVGPLCILWGEAFHSSNLLISSGTASILTGALIGYNQSFIRALISYSSISHSGWIVLSFTNSFGLFLIYITIYFISVIILFSVFSITEVNNVVATSTNPKSWTTASLLILIISGIPPFSIFYLNASIIYYIVSYYLFLPFILLGAMLSIYFYFTFIIPSLVNQWLNNATSPNNLTLITTVIGMLAPVLIIL